MNPARFAPCIMWLAGGFFLAPDAHAIQDRNEATNRAGLSPEFNINPAIANPLYFIGPSGYNVDRTITIENIGDPGSVLTLAQDTGNLLTAPFSISSGLPNNMPGIAAGTSATIGVRCLSFLFTFTFSDDLVLTTNDPDDGESTVTIPLQCTIYQDISPELRATFNGVEVNDGGAVSLSALQNTSASAVLSFGTGAFPLQIGARSGLSGVLSIGAPSTIIVDGGVAPGTAAASNLLVTCTPGATLSTTQALSVVNTDLDENPFDLQITCLGVPQAVATINPTSIAINGSPVTIGTGTSVLMNTGNIDLSVTGCSAPADFDLTAPTVFPTSLVPGAAVTLAVSCATPTAGATPLTGNLTCQSNAAANQGAISIPLSCSGTVPAIPANEGMAKILMAALFAALGLMAIRLRAYAGSSSTR
jgi:hypothetical protein